MSYNTHNEHHNEYLKYELPINPANVGMVVGTPILNINNKHRGWAKAQLQQHENAWPVFIISGHPGHVVDIAVAITGIATTPKIRSDNCSDPSPPSTRPPHLNLDGIWSEPAPEYHRPAENGVEE